MEISDNSIIVMNAKGRFDKLPRDTRSCELGEEILYAPVKRRLRIPQMAIVSGLAAAIVVCFVLVSSLTGNGPGNSVVAYVTIDINPSVEIGIDNKEVVRDLHGLNADGEQLIESLIFKGKSLEDVTSDILDRAEQVPALAKGEGDIIISSTVVGSNTSVSDEAIATKLKAQVSKHIEDSHPYQVKDYEVQAFAAPQEVRKEAQASGVSTGKYAIYLNAKENGVNVSIDDIKSTSIHQIAKENGGIQTLVKPDRPIDKISLQKLLDEEKSGKLSEKFQQMTEKSGSTNTPNKDNDKNNNGRGNNNGSNSGNTPRGQVTSKPTATPKNNRDNNNNKNDSNNGRNNNNDRNNNDNKDNGKDDHSSTPKSNRNDGENGDDKKPTGTKKPSSTPKATIKPTAIPTIKPTAKATQTPRGDGKFNGITWDWGNKDRLFQGNHDWKQN